MKFVFACAIAMKMLNPEFLHHNSGYWASPEKVNTGADSLYHNNKGDALGKLKNGDIVYAIVRDPKTRNVRDIGTYYFQLRNTTNFLFDEECDEFHLELQDIECVWRNSK